VLEIWIVMQGDVKATHRIRLSLDHLAVGLKAYLAGDRRP
jgi:hypothetical protein